jgi:hypothetical protein
MRVVVRRRANVYPPGISTLHGVSVHRIPTTIPRDTGRFNQLNMRLVAAVRARPLEVQREWMRMQGPQSDGIPCGCDNTRVTTTA